MPDRVAFSGFLEKLHELDTDRRIDELIWNEFPASIRALLDSRYVCHQFWQLQRGQIDQEQWELWFNSAKKAAQIALKKGSTPTLLSIVFDRLYTLRNQLIHGGATWGGKVNRTQLRDCTRLLGKLVPLIVALMMDNPNTIWGDAVYPVVDNDG